MKHFSAIILVFLAALTASAQRVRIDITPSGEYMFAQRDTCQLFMSVYDPAPESDTRFEGKAKPTILFIFGGGFISGDRNSRGYLPWFRKYNDNGYKVITIDYRLGLKGAGNVGAGNVGTIYNAIQIGVEDLFSATSYIIENAEALDVDPSNIVVSGSSAGAMIAMQAEWHICNRSGHAGMLPEGFNYAGIMPFSGAILSREGKIRFAKEPAPVLPHEHIEGELSALAVVVRPKQQQDALDRRQEQEGPQDQGQRAEQPLGAERLRAAALR